MIRAAILTISDSSARGAREDRSGPRLAERLQQLGWMVEHTEILPDEAAAIAGRLSALADGGGVNLILTTGGTGVGPRDVTPEATKAILEKEIPGFGELMRLTGREHTKFAALSRAVAGIRGMALIVNLPGSPKGAVESLDAVAVLIPHTVDLIEGRTEHK